MTRTASLAVALLALAGAVGLDLRIADRLLARPYDVAVVPSGEATRIASLGHRTFVSDLYWLQAVQYIGDPKADERGFEKLYPLVDLVTDLDPRHGYAYQTAGIVLSAMDRLEESNRILEKGVEKGPPYWTFPYYLAFNYWFYRADYEMAAYWARVAATKPGASNNISQLALSLSAKGGSPDEAIRVLSELRATVKDEVSASKLEEQLALAYVERDAQALERAAARFRERRGRDPWGLQELVAGGFVAAIPRDPWGGTYVWRADERRVRSTSNPFRFNPPEAAHPPGPIQEPAHAPPEPAPMPNLEVLPRTAP